MDYKLLIHIGFHKTGTTWLQENYFIKNPDIYKTVGNNVKEFAYNFIYGRGDYKNPFDFNGDKIKDRFTTFFNSLDENDKNKVLIISDEDLCGHMWSGGVQARRIADDLRSVFPDAKILITIREQVNAIVSSYKHFIRAGGSCSIGQYLKTGNEFQVPLFNPLFFDYYSTVMYYQKIFGKQNVLCLAQELLSENKEEYIKNIQKFLNIREEKKYFDPRLLNTSNDKEAVWYYLLRLSGLFRKSRNLSGKINLCPVILRSIVNKVFIRLIKILSQLTTDKCVLRFNRKLKNKVMTSIIKNEVIERIKLSNRRLNEIVNIEKYNYIL